MDKLPLLSSAEHYILCALLDAAIRGERVAWQRVEAGWDSGASEHATRRALAAWWCLSEAVRLAEELLRGRALYDHSPAYWWEPGVPGQVARGHGAEGRGPARRRYVLSRRPVGRGGRGQPRYHRRRDKTTGRWVVAGVRAGGNTTRPIAAAAANGP